MPSCAYDYEAIDLSHLRADAESCRRCPLWRNATQTVFGEGPAPAAMMLVGEQPEALWITVHPSSLLRLPGETSRQREFKRFVKDLQGAKGWVASHRNRAV